jgi:hypothetical protein
LTRCIRSRSNWMSIPIAFAVAAVTRARISCRVATSTAVPWRRADRGGQAVALRQSAWARGLWGDALALCSRLPRRRLEIPA